MFKFIQNNFVRLYCDSCHIGVPFKKLIKIGQFLCSHFNIEGGKNTHFWPIMLYYIKKGKNVTERQKKIVQCTEKVLLLTEHVRSGL